MTHKNTLKIKGVECQDFITDAGLNCKLLKMCGIILLDARMAPTMISNILATFSFLSLSLYSVTYTLIFILYMDNLEAATAYLSLVMSFVSGQCRFSLLLWSRAKIMAMLQEYGNLWSALSSEEKRKIHFFLNKSQWITMTYMSFCAFTILSYAIAFILQPETLDANNQTSTRHLPYAFLLQVSETPFYEITYAIQMVSIVNIGFTCVACDTTGMFLVMITCGHFTVIHERITCFWNMYGQEKSNIVYLTVTDGQTCADVNYKNSVNERETLKMIASCIKYHQDILILCNEIEKLTNFIFLTGLIGTTYNLSLMGFKITSNDPAKLTYAFQIAILIMQLFVYNWPPDLLVTYSSEISNAVWYSPWYIFSSKPRKLLSFVIKMAHRPVRLTAGKLFFLSLENFASMISAAVSFFTVLSTVN